MDYVRGKWIWKQVNIFTIGKVKGIKDRKYLPWVNSDEPSVSTRHWQFYLTRLLPGTTALNSVNTNLATTLTLYDHREMQSHERVWRKVYYRNPEVWRDLKALLSPAVFENEWEWNGLATAVTNDNVVAKITDKAFSLIIKCSWWLLATCYTKFHYCKRRVGGASGQILRWYVHWQAGHTYYKNENG